VESSIFRDVTVVCSGFILICEEISLIVITKSPIPCMLVTVVLLKATVQFYANSVQLSLNA